MSEVYVCLSCNYATTDLGQADAHEDEKLGSHLMVIDDPDHIVRGYN